MNKVILQLGSNLKKKDCNLKTAIDKIEKKIGVVYKKSKIYISDPWGKINQPKFLNQVIIVKSRLTAEEVLEKIFDIEKRMGRKRKKKWEARIIDIDILFYNNQIINNDSLVIPHPYLHKRKFVLKPLIDIDPEFLHPIYKKKMNNLFMDCTDKNKVEEYEL